VTGVIEIQELIRKVLAKRIALLTKTVLPIRSAALPGFKTNGRRTTGGWIAVTGLSNRAGKILISTGLILADGNRTGRMNTNLIGITVLVSLPGSDVFITIAVSGKTAAISIAQTRFHVVARVKAGTMVFRFAQADLTGRKIITAVTAGPGGTLTGRSGVDERIQRSRSVWNSRIRRVGH
jgi:hypothetical protein